MKRKKLPKTFMMIYHNEKKHLWSPWFRENPQRCKGVGVLELVLLWYNTCALTETSRPLGNERVYLSLYKVADTPFHIQLEDFI